MIAVILSTCIGFSVASASVLDGECETSHSSLSKVLIQQDRQLLQSAVVGRSVHRHASQSQQVPDEPGETVEEQAAQDAGGAGAGGEAEGVPADESLVSHESPHQDEEKVGGDNDKEGGAVGPEQDPFLSDAGFKSVAMQNDDKAMLRFVKRVTEHLGLQETANSHGVLLKISGKHIGQETAELKTLTEEILEAGRQDKLEIIVSVKKGKEPPLNENGYKITVQEQDEGKIVKFIERAAKHEGYKITDKNALSGVAPFYNGVQGLQTYADLQAEFKKVSKEKKGWVVATKKQEEKNNAEDKSTESEKKDDAKMDQEAEEKEDKAEKKEDKADKKEDKAEKSEGKSEEGEDGKKDDKAHVSGDKSKEAEDAGSDAQSAGKKEDKAEESGDKSGEARDAASDEQLAPAADQEAGNKEANAERSEDKVGESKDGASDDQAAPSADQEANKKEDNAEESGDKSGEAKDGASDEQAAPAADQEAGNKEANAEKSEDKAGKSKDGASDEQAAPAADEEASKKEDKAEESGDKSEESKDSESDEQVAPAADQEVGKKEDNADKSADKSGEAEDGASDEQAAPAAEEGEKRVHEAKILTSEEQTASAPEQVTAAPAVDSAAEQAAPAPASDAGPAPAEQAAPAMTGAAAPAPVPTTDHIAAPQPASLLSAKPTKNKAEKEDKPDEKKNAKKPLEEVAPFNQDAFKEVVELNSKVAMSTYVHRLIDALGLVVTNGEGMKKIECLDKKKARTTTFFNTVKLLLKESKQRIWIKSMIQPRPGDKADLSEEGYLAVVEMQNNDMMELFIKRVIEADKLHLVGDKGEGGVSGMAPYYSGVIGFQDFSRLKTEIKEKSNDDKVTWLAKGLASKEDSASQKSTSASGKESESSSKDTEQDEGDLTSRKADSSSDKKASKSSKKASNKKDLTGTFQRYDDACYYAGSDVASRDATCVDGLKCARKGFNGRNYGDCPDKTCCSKVPQK